MELPFRNPSESFEVRQRIRETALQRHLDWVASLESGDTDVIGEFLQYICLIENMNIAAEKLMGRPVDRTELSLEPGLQTENSIDMILNHDGAIDRGDPNAVSQAIDMQYNSLNFGYVANIG